MKMEFMYAGMLQSKLKSNWFFGNVSILFQNLHQPFQDQSETELAQHENHPTVVGLPNDGVEQHLVVELQKTCQKRREYLITSKCCRNPKITENLDRFFT